MKQWEILNPQAGYADSRSVQQAREWKATQEVFLLLLDLSFPTHMKKSPFFFFWGLQYLSSFLMSSFAKFQDTECLPRMSAPEVVSQSSRSTQNSHHPSSLGIHDSGRWCIHPPSSLTSSIQGQILKLNSLRSSQIYFWFTSGVDWRWNSKSCLSQRYSCQFYKRVTISEEWKAKESGSRLCMSHLSLPSCQNLRWILRPVTINGGFTMEPSNHGLFPSMYLCSSQSYRSSQFSPL